MLDSQIANRASGIAPGTVTRSGRGPPPPDHRENVVGATHASPSNRNIVHPAAEAACRGHRARRAALRGPGRPSGRFETYRHDDVAIGFQRLVRVEELVPQRGFEPTRHRVALHLQLHSIGSFRDPDLLVARVVEEVGPIARGDRIQEQPQRTSVSADDLVLGNGVPACGYPLGPAKTRNRGTLGVKSRLSAPGGHLAGRGSVCCPTV